jgi:hypothetical protein
VVTFGLMASRRLGLRTDVVCGRLSLSKIDAEPAARRVGASDLVNFVAR